jgi:hypothetical protein
MSHVLSWSSSAGLRACSKAFGCARGSCSGTVGARDPTLRLPGSAAPVRLDSSVSPVRSGQRHRDIDLATRSPSSSATSKHPDRPGLTGRSCPRWPRLLPHGHCSQLRLIVSPRTLLRWHADIIRHRWCYPHAGPDARLSSERSATWRWRWHVTIRPGDTGASTASSPAWASRSRPRPSGRSSTTLASTPHPAGMARPGAPS